MSLLTPGGTILNGAPIGLATWVPGSVTSGNNSADIANTCFYAGVYVPGTCLATGITYLVGGTGGTDLVFASLFDISGNLIANSAAAGATVGTTAQTQSLAFTLPLVLDAPNYYLIGLTFNGANATLRTIPIYCDGGAVAGSVTQTFATGPASITPSGTKFSANVGPIAWIY